MNLIKKHFNKEHQEKILKALEDNNLDINLFEFDGDYELDQDYHLYNFQYFKSNGDSIYLEITAYKTGEIELQIQENLNKHYE